MVTDPIADMMTRIRNAVHVERPFVDVPMSRFKCGVADALKREGFVWEWQEVRVTDGPGGSVLRIALKYGANGERVIQSIRRVSKPGRRVYVRSAQLRPILGGLGITILSTSQGVFSDREARAKNLGGEVLCEVY